VYVSIADQLGEIRHFVVTIPRIALGYTATWRGQLRRVPVTRCIVKGPLGSDELIVGRPISVGLL